jgi:Tol biopolymer transport system component/DNA-binding winged helix-turn-helix (wHTH) protein
MFKLYEFGPFRLDASCRKILLAGDAVSCTGKQFDVLYAVVKREGGIAETEAIIEEVWPGDRSDSESKRGRLARHISDLRKILSPNAGGLNYIKQVSGQGYFINAPVRVVTAAQEIPAAKGRLWMVAAATFAIFAAVSFSALRPEGLRATGYRPLTDDGRIKSGPLLTDGQKVFFIEQIDNQWRAMSVPVTGGDVTALNIPLQVPFLSDISADRSTLLLGTYSPPDFKIWSWPINGGTPQEISRIRSPAAWAPDRKTIAFGGESLTVDRSGVEWMVSPASQFDAISSLKWAPDGTRIGFTLTEPKKDWRSSIWQSDRDGKNWERMEGTTRSGENQTNGTWTADGRYFLYESGAPGQRRDLWALPSGKRLGSLFAEATRLTEGPLNWTWPGPARNGTQIFALGDSFRGELVRLDPHTGDWSPYLGGLPAYELDFSQDGKWITYTRYPQHTIWKARADGSERVQLTGSEFDAHQPHWSPDGTKIAFMAQQSGKAWRVLIIEAATGAIEEPVPDGDDQGVPTWSNDGQSLVFGDRLFVKDRSAMVIRVLDRRTRELSVVPGSADLWTPRWSPDGKFISALRPDGTALLLSRCCFGEWTTILDHAESLDDSMWSSDSKFIFIMAGMGPGHRQLQRVSIPDGRVERIADTSSFPVPGEHWFGIAPDGSALGLRGARLQEIYAIDVR